MMIGRSTWISTGRELGRDPDDAAKLNDRGMMAAQAGALEQALELFDRAIAVDPKFVQAHNNRGNVLSDLGRRDEALASYREALKLRPDYPHGRFNASVLLLALGRFGEGWDLYEGRRDLPSLPPRAFDTAELPSLADAAGRRLFVHAEQGLGDTLQFLRYIPLLVARAEAVKVEVQPDLVPFCEQWLGLPVYARGTPTPAYDRHIPLLSLPRLFRTALQSVPPVLAVRPDTSKIADWRHRLGPGGFKIGVVWHGNAEFEGNQTRSFPIRDLAGLAAIDGVRLIALQKGGGLNQLDALPAGMRVERPGTDLAVTDTAAIMACCDLVISACTMPAHLAGMLRRPVWIALSTTPDWRWMLDRDDSPWYPTARLFRQPKPGDWESVFQQMADEIRRMQGFRGI